MTRETVDPGFAPADITDERDLGDWKTRYPEEAWKLIRNEAIWLATHLLSVLAIVIILPAFSNTQRSFLFNQNAAFNPEPNNGSATAMLPSTANLQLPQHVWPQLFYAWCGGILGGTVFSMKWLYHVVAKNLWHYDRRLWRLFTPHLSGALAVTFLILIGSGLIAIFDTKALTSVWVCFGFGFLVGCFSDSAMAKLSEVATTLFGTTKSIDASRRQATDHTNVNTPPLP